MMKEWRYSTEFFWETNYDTNDLDKFFNQNEHSLRDNQKKVYHSILNGIENHKKVALFIDAPDGTGKTS